MSAGATPPRPLRVLILEDSLLDTALLVAELERAGFAPAWERVDTDADYLARLDPSLDVILADNALPGFAGRRALDLLRGRGIDVPLVVVSGAISEELAVAALEAGAADYVPKDRLSCLGLAIERLLAHRRLREEGLRRSRRQLRALAARLQRAREEERARVAREIHDELGQALTALKMDLAWLQRHGVRAAAGREVDERLGQMSGMVDATIAAVRRIASELRPAVLDDLGLAAAIEWQAQQIEARSAVAFELDLAPLAVEPENEVSTALFRILQEALTNVVRHARARRVRIALGESGGRLVLEVADDGRGVSETEAAAPGSLGLLGMRERAELLGGELVIRGVPGEGTTVTASVPIRRARRQPAAAGRDKDGR